MDLGTNWVIDGEDPSVEEATAAAAAVPPPPPDMEKKKMVDGNNRNFKQFTRIS